MLILQAEAALQVDRSFLLPCSQGARLTRLPSSWDSGAKESSAGPTPPALPGPAPRENPELVWHNLHPLSWLSEPEHTQAAYLGSLGKQRAAPCVCLSTGRHRDSQPPPAPSLCADAFACKYKCGSMFSEGCVPSARCDISWKEFQRALCKVLNKLLNKTESVSAEAK